MSVKNILITDRFSQESLISLQQQPFLKVEKSPFPHLEQTDISEVHGLIIRSRTQITENLLKRAKNLQVIVTATSGFDHIDLHATEKWGITVMHTPEANVESAAQLAWSLLLTGSRKIVESHKQVKSGTWQRDLLMGTELEGKTLGIVGLGRIGRRVAQIAKAFRMQVLAYDPYLDENIFIQEGCTRSSYEELLKCSDYLSFHVPRTKLTQNMLNRSHFEYIHRGIGIINVSRGGVIHELDLAQALTEGWLSFCALDVYEKEPLDRNSNLLKFSNVILTPHIGANTYEAFAKASDQAAILVLKFFMDGSTENTLPPKSAWYLEA